VGPPDPAKHSRSKQAMLDNILRLNRRKRDGYKPIPMSEFNAKPLTAFAEAILTKPSYSMGKVHADEFVDTIWGVGLNFGTPEANRLISLCEKVPGDPQVSIGEFLAVVLPGYDLGPLPPSAQVQQDAANELRAAALAQQRIQLASHSTPVVPPLQMRELQQDATQWNRHQFLTEPPPQSLWSTRAAEQFYGDHERQHALVAQTKVCTVSPIQHIRPQTARMATRAADARVPVEGMSELQQHLRSMEQSVHSLAARANVIPVEAARPATARLAPRDRRPADGMEQPMHAGVSERERLAQARLAEWSTPQQPRPQQVRPASARGVRGHPQRATPGRPQQQRPRSRGSSRNSFGPAADRSTNDSKQSDWNSPQLRMRRMQEWRARNAGR